MEQKQLSPRNSYTDLLECSLMMSSSKSNCDKMTHCSLRRDVSRLLYELLDTSRPCVATIAARSRPRSPGRRPCSSACSVRQEFQQVDAEARRPLSGETSHEARRCPPRDRRRLTSEQLLEHRASSQVSPIRRGCRDPLRQPPFCTGLAAVACNPLYKARRRPWQQIKKP